MRIFKHLDCIDSFCDLIYLVHLLKDDFAHEDGSFGLGESELVCIIAISSRFQRLEVVEHSFGSR